MYFHSGYFYPNSEEDIRYRMREEGTGTDIKYSWVPQGEGPYYSPPWDLTASSNTTLTDNDSIWGTDALELYAQVSDEAQKQRYVSSTDYLASLERGSHASLRFTQVLEENKLKFEHSITFTSVPEASRTYTEFNVNVELGSNSTKTFEMKPTMSFVEYLTDLMDFAGLFTGVCLFSIMVAPANIYLKRFRKKPKAVEP